MMSGFGQIAGLCGDHESTVLDPSERRVCFYLGLFVCHRGQRVTDWDTGRGADKAAIVERLEVNMQ